MKVIHVLETLSPHYGGPVSVLKQIARQQRQSGVDVRIFTTCADYPSGTYKTPGWGTLENSDVPVFYGRVDVAPLKVSFSFARELKQALREADVVHIHGMYRFPPSYAAYAARRAKKPYVIRPFGSLDPYIHARSSRSVMLKRMYESLIDFPNLRKADAIQFTAEEEKRRASFVKLRNRQVVIPNPLDGSRFETLPARGAMRARWGLAADVPVVLFLGRIHPRKGLDLLVEAFRHVRAEVPEARLVIVGPENDGYGAGLRGKVAQAGLAEAIHFCGPLNQTEVIQAYVDADIFALPSYTENFGMTVVEAMATGLPVVISDQVNISDQILADRAGLVTRCDATEVAQALLKLLAEPALRTELVERARETVKRRYELKAVSDALLEEYRTIVQTSA